MRRHTELNQRERNDIDSYDQKPVSGSARTAAMTVLLIVLLIFAVSATQAKEGNAGMQTSSASEKCPTCITGCNIIPTSHVDGMYPFKIISDMDQSSKVEGGKYVQWMSKLKSGTLTRDAATGKYSLTWGETSEITSMHSYKGRGMELSELIKYNGDLLSFDDTTGIVYKIADGEDPVPWVILSDGAGRVNKGFKCEWATVKGNLLYVGSMGKEWTHPKTGEVVNHDPQFVKVIAPDGHVTNVDWAPRYNKMREVAGTSAPGYMIHESGNWHEELQRWVFLPRRMSAEQYNDELDEERAANKMILATEDFSEVTMVENIGPYSKTRGFSSFKFIPGHPDEFVALKSEEYKSSIKAYITVLNMKGETLMPEQLIEDVKYEGIELI